MSPTGSPAWQAGRAAAERKAQLLNPGPASSSVTVSIPEPAPWRQVLAKCPRCGGWVSDTVPADRHGVHFANREGGPVLVRCDGTEVAP